MIKATPSWDVWQRAVPAGIGSLGYTVGDGAAARLGEASAGDGVGAARVAGGLTVGVGDGFTAVGDEGVHAATIIATTQATSPNCRWRT